MKIEHERSALQVSRGTGSGAKLVRLTLTDRTNGDRPVDIHLTPAEARVVATMLAETARELK